MAYCHYVEGSAILVLFPAHSYFFMKL